MFWYLLPIEQPVLRKTRLYEINAIYREKHSAYCRKSGDELLRADMKGKIDNDIGNKQDPSRLSSPLSLPTGATMVEWCGTRTSLHFPLPILSSHFSISVPHVPLEKQF